MSDQENKEWFELWFNSPFYPVLYNHRDETEAIFFLNHLVDHLQPNVEDKMLDLACGRGRHAIYLNKLGFDVTGVDLSEESIRDASRFASPSLHFYEHDMRRLLSTNTYEYVFNLFTSFGYFDRDHENQLVVKNMAMTLKPGGRLIIDFLNAEKLRKHGRTEESKLIQGVQFLITKEIRNGRIIKNIDIEHGAKTYHFEEKVSLLGPEEFEAYFQSAGLQIEHVFGNYALDAFNADNSERLIYEVRKV